MKIYCKIYIAVIALLLSGITSVAAPVMRWLGTEYNFGAIEEEGGVVACTFLAVNDGDEPLVILNARANCGCTHPSYSPRPVEPGDTFKITVGYDPKGRPGRFEKYVRMETNAEPKRSVLTISGSVVASPETAATRFPVDLGAVRLRDEIIVYGEVFKGKTAGAYIEGYNTSNDSVRPYVDGVPQHLMVKIVPETVPPGEQFVISTVANSYRTNEWGPVTGDFDFYPDMGAQAARLSTVLTIKEDFSALTPEQLRDAPVADLSVSKLDFGVINPASGKVKEATFEIANTGKNQLIVRSIKCVGSGAVTIENFKPDTKIKSGKKLKITVKMDSKELAGKPLLNAKITVITNDPEDPSQTVRIVGEVSK